MNRYEEILADGSPLPAAMATASMAAREATAAETQHQAAIRDVAAGVAAPALVGYVLWVFDQARRRHLDRLCFLSRDAQVFHEIAVRLAPRVGVDAELHYVHSSRRTWSFAASDPSGLRKQDWLFNSFMRSNAEDVLARLGLPLAGFSDLLASAGASLDPSVRADTPSQGGALRRFVGLPPVASAVAPRIDRMRSLIREYAGQEGMASSSTGLVDAGWTGRMIGALTSIIDGLPQPRVFYWGHEPRSTGWTDPARVTAYMFNTATGEGLDLRVPGNPYIIETFCMSNHGIIADYRRGPGGLVQGVPETSSNTPVESWGFDTFRSTIYAFCDALPSWSLSGDMPSSDVRPVISRVLHAFWIMPTVAEAAAWGCYPYDSDPLARATRPLARPFGRPVLEAVIRGDPLDQGDRAWIQGSLALSGSLGAEAAAVLAPTYATLGAPATD